MSDNEGSRHPSDVELTRRAIIFHEKLAILKAYEGEPPWALVVETAAASHFLYGAKMRALNPNVWERISATTNLIYIARGIENEGGTISIGYDAAQEMIFRAYEDPDYHEALKLFCSHALKGEPMPYSGETTFVPHLLLSRWIGNVAIKEIRKPKTRKRQTLSSKIVNEAIANTVQFLHDNDIPVFRNDATESSVNACDAVAEISGDVLGRRPIKGHAVQKIYYASEWGKWRKLEQP